MAAESLVVPGLWPTRGPSEPFSRANPQDFDLSPARAAATSIWSWDGGSPPGEGMARAGFGGTQCCVGMKSKNLAEPVVSMDSG